MTELQTLIRDSNGMPPVIRADYLEDHGYDLEADWLRRGDRKKRPDFEGLAQGTESVLWDDGYIYGRASGVKLIGERESEFTDGFSPGIYYSRFFRSDWTQGMSAGSGNGSGSSV